MNYVKPEVTLTDHAVAAIQSNAPSKHGVTSDGTGLDRFITSPAYEADE